MKEKLPVSILFVDDDEHALNYFGEIIARYVKNVYYAVDGKKGIEVFNQFNPEIILADIVMPVMDGLEMSKHIKTESPKTKIILASAYQEFRHLTDAIDIGVDAFIRKPIFKDKLYSLIEKVGNEIILEKNLQKAYSDLRNSEQQLRELNLSKDKLISVLAHDLRGPFNALIGFAQTMQMNVRDKDYAKQGYMADVIYNTSTRTFNLLESLLQWAQSQSGKLTVCPIPINVKKIVEENIKFLTPLAYRKNISIDSSINDNLEVLADKEMLATVLRNLITNAIKFSFPNSKINIYADLQINNNQNGRNVEFEVCDTGVGISTENLAKLFKVGEKVKTKGTAEEKGSGFGLILCKEFVERNGGIIYAESEPGKGSTFRFTAKAVN
jgi:signal transduction histidine kinase